MSTALPVRLLRLPLIAERDQHPSPAWVFEALAALDLHWQLAVVGTDDLHDGAGSWRTQHLLARHTDSLVLVAVPAGEATTAPETLGDVPLVTEDGTASEVLGYATVHLPLRDNLTLGHVDVVVRHDVRRRGIGTALDAAARAVAAGLGRRTLQGWTGHRSEGGEDGEGGLVAPTGVGTIARDEATEFALARGYRLEQTERHSLLAVPTRERLRELRDAAQAAAPGYRVVSWIGPTPEAYLDGVADMYRRMSTDIPLAELELEEEQWDAQRVADADARALAGGRTLAYSVAVHEASGAVVAFSILKLPDARPAVAWQDETLVAREHRGHRLGMLVKAANLLAARGERPELARVHTWNAGENAHMLAINTELGFRRASTEGAWQLRL